MWYTHNSLGLGTEDRLTALTAKNRPVPKVNGPAILVSSD